VTGQAPTDRRRAWPALLGLWLALLGCGRCGAPPPPPRTPSPLERTMQAATFARPGDLAPLPFRLHAPARLEGKAPLIVWLHSTEGRGADNARQLTPEVELLVDERVQRLGPAFVLAPQCREGEKWSNKLATFPLQPYDLSAVPESEVAGQVVALVETLAARYPIDRRRLYLMGFSMGGSGTWDALMRHPDLFAAGVPIVGVADVSRAALLSRTPIWQFHGELDPTSPVENGRRMAEALRRAGAPSRYTELGGVGHGAVGPALQTPGLFEWLFEQRR
jgi:predicted peptidase